MQRITTSVGRGGINSRNDTKTVQGLLNSALKSAPGFRPLAVDGIAGPKTNAAIEMYQRKTFGWSDGRVDPSGKTITSLKQQAGSGVGGGGAQTPAPRTPVSGGRAVVQMTNQGATRNLPITATLKAKLEQAVGAVFGAGAVVSVYSGGQPALGSGGQRVGSVRHDDGHAADLTIRANGADVGLEGMERLGQWWLASRFGCAGVGMQSGRGIHLDEWGSNSGPALQGGMGPLWTYDGGAGPNTRRILQRGHGGEMP